MGDSQRTVRSILEAAQRVIVRKGASGTTIEEVAREAAISKGGVLHHFPNKESILIGLVRSLMAGFEADIETRRGKDPHLPGSFTRAFLQCALRPEEQCVEVAHALSAAFREVPALQELQREAHSRWQSRVENDGIDPVRARVVLLAADGLWLARVHGPHVRSKPVSAELIDFLISLTRGEKTARSKRPKVA